MHWCQLVADIPEGLASAWHASADPYARAARTSLYPSKAGLSEDCTRPRKYLEVKGVILANDIKNLGDSEAIVVALIDLAAGNPRKRLLHHQAYPQTFKAITMQVLAFT